MNISLRNEIRYSPVPYERLVEFVRQWAARNGITIQSLSETPFDSSVETAISDDVVTAVIEASINGGYITFARGGHKLAKEMCKDAIPKGQWKKVKGSAVAVRRTAVLGIICDTFEKRVGLFAELLAACGFGDFPASVVTTTIIMDALGAI